MAYSFEFLETILSIFVVVQVAILLVFSDGRKEKKNTYFANIGFDKTGNEPRQVCCNCFTMGAANNLRIAAALSCAARKD